MLYFKVLGGTSIFLSAAIFYFESKRYERAKIRQADAFISLLRYIKKQIECFSAPISTIIDRCDKNILENCGIWTSCEQDSLGEVIGKCDFCIDEEAIDTLKKFGEEFGKTYREDQLRSCDYYISELVKYKEKLAQEIPKEQKMRLAVCFCLSGSIILLFI